MRFGPGALARCHGGVDDVTVGFIVSRAVFSDLVRFGGDLLSHVYDAVPSAQWRLTTEFGMGSGVSLTLSPPNRIRSETRDGLSASILQVDLGLCCF